MTCRPAFSAASMTARMRPTFDEKVVMATRPGALAITSARPSLTSRSVGETPSRMALVESQTKAKTPWSPSARKRASSVLELARTGFSSIFQSPVCRMVPSGVVIASAVGSGMECAMRMASILNGPRSNVSPGAKICTGTFGASPSPRRFDSSRPAVNAVMCTLALRRGHRARRAP